MSQQEFRFGRSARHAFVCAATLGAVVLSLACRSASTPAAKPVSPDAYAVVDGREIMAADVEKAYRRGHDPAQILSDEEALTAKLGILDNLIVQDILLAKARTLNVDVTPAELDTAYNDAQKNVPAEAFQQELTARNLTAADMREGLRRDLLTQKVVEQELGSKIVVADKEISDFFEANKAQFNVPEESYHLAQIVVTPVRDAQIANRSGDDATTPEAAAAKAKMLMERLQAGASFQDLAAGYSEDPESAPRGGDLGNVPASRLKQAPAQLREAVLNKPAGSVSVASSGGAHTLVLVVSHDMAGQRDLSTPGVKEQISEVLRGRREQLLRTAYLTAARSDAAVTNYFARRLIESKPSVPTMPLSTPGAK